MTTPSIHSSQPTEKEILIAAFKSLDFDALYNLLDDNRTYMDVTKDLFLSRLKQKLDNYSDLKSFESLTEGICNYCNKGCKAYKFKSENFPSLSLFFEEKNGQVIDIYLCNGFKGESPDENDDEIYLSFYEEEKVGFEPSLEHLITLQRVEKAVEDFKSLEAVGLVTMQEVEYWYNKMKTIAEDLKLNNPFVSIKYMAFKYLASIYSTVSNLVHNLKNNDLAKNALVKYHEIDMEDERCIVKWLLENKRNYFFSLKKTENWKNTGIIILESEPYLVVDCSEYLDGFIYDEIYDTICNNIMAIYRPTDEHFDQNGGSVECSLESYLRLHKKYLDLL